MVMVVLVLRGGLATGPLLPVVLLVLGGHAGGEGRRRGRGRAALWLLLLLLLWLGWWWLRLGSGPGRSCGRHHRGACLRAFCALSVWSVAQGQCEGTVSVGVCAVCLEGLFSCHCMHTCE